MKLNYSNLSIKLFKYYKRALRFYVSILFEKGQELYYDPHPK